MPFTSPLMLGASEVFSTATIQYSDDRDTTGEVQELTAFSIVSDPDNILDIIESGPRGAVSVNQTGQYRFTLVSNYTSSNTALFGVGQFSTDTYWGGFSTILFNLDTANDGDTATTTITNDTSGPAYTDCLMVDTNQFTGSLSGSCQIKVEYLG